MHLLSQSLRRSFIIICFYLTARKNRRFLNLGVFHPEFNNRAFVQFKIAIPILRNDAAIIMSVAQRGAAHCLHSIAFFFGAQIGKVVAVVAAALLMLPVENSQVTHVFVIQPVTVVDQIAGFIPHHCAERILFSDRLRIFEVIGVDSPSLSAVSP